MFLKLIWRNIWRNKRRTTIIVVSIIFAVFFTTVNQSNKLALFSNMLRCSVEYFTGYVQIHKQNFWEERSINSAFNLDDSTFSNFKKNPDIKSIAPRIESYALGFGNEKTKGVMIVGIDAIEENNLTNLSKRVIKGSYLEPNDDQILIGKGIAKYFNLNINDTLIFIGQGYHGANAVNQYSIKGIVSYPSDDLNNSVVFMPIKVCQDFHKTGDLVTGYCFNINADKTTEVTNYLKGNVDAEEFEVMDWEIMLPEVKQFINLVKFMNNFIEMIIYLIVGIGLFSVYYMMINERTYEFGMLIASGLDRLKLQIITYLEAIVLALFGIVIGLIISFVVIYIYDKNPVVLTGDYAAVYIKMGVEPIYKLEIAAIPFIKQSISVLFIALIIGTYSIRKIQKLDINTTLN